MNYELKREKESIRPFPRGFSHTSYFIFHTSSQKGFTIIETVVAIAILAIAVVAPLTLAQRSLNAGVYAREQVTAFYLAQEAVEYVRNIRDNNGLNSVVGYNNWLSGLEQCRTGPCSVDPSNDTPSSRVQGCDITTTSTCDLVFDTAQKTYRARNAPTDVSKVSVFRRTLEIKNVGGLDPSNVVDVVSTVKWNVGSLSKTVVINARIFNWYKTQ